MAEYIVSVLVGWVAVVGGLLALPEIVKFFRGKPTPTLEKLPLRLRLGIGVLILFYQQYSMFAEQRGTLAKRDAELDSAITRISELERAKPAVDLSRPLFRGHFVDLLWNEKGVYVDVVLINSGAPSIASQWAMYVIPRDKTERIQLQTVAANNPPDEKFLFGTSNRKVELRHGDSIYHKTKSIIPTGGHLQGHMVGLWRPGMLNILKTGFGVVITVEDSLQNEYEFDVPPDPPQLQPMPRQ